MFKDQFYISTLIAAYLQDEIDIEQKQELDKWLQISEANRHYLKDEFGEEERIREMLGAYQSMDEAAVWSKTIYRLQNLKDKPAENIPVKKLYNFSFKIAAAAVLLTIASIASWFYLDYKSNAYANDVPAGKNAATLTLANGHKIILSNAVKGELAKEAGVSIRKTVNGQIVYELAAPSAIASKSLQPHTDVVAYNTLSTAKGQTYQVVLPDKSVVWLNAGSSLKYPSSFTALKLRKVELFGEAYFEVAKDKEHPFIVQTGRQIVKVLGTHFNISNYEDESSIRTTLVEGSVLVNDKTILKPGEESAFANQSITVKPANTEIAIAWKNGFFRFKDEPLVNIMRKISRWYNVDVIYAPDAPKDITLGGFISRSKNISAVLEMMTLTESVRFEVEGRKITVLKYK